MKLRFITLGTKDGLDNRSFGFQRVAKLKTYYLRLWFFGVYLALGKQDILADLHRLNAERRAQAEYYRTTNRKMRRTIEELSRKHAR